MAPTETPIPIRRGKLRGHAAAVYIPRQGRGARHYADTFSVGLWLCKLDPEKGAEWAFDFAGALVGLVPEGTQMIATPPASRRRSAAGWYFARELGAAVARRVVCDEDLAGLRVCLVDDLWTTGITLEQCAQALKEAGAQWSPGIVTLAATESTKARPKQEKWWRTSKRKLRRERRGARQRDEPPRRSAGRGRPSPIACPDPEGEGAVGRES